MSDKTFYSVVQSRRTARKFKNRVVEPDAIHRVLACGLQAPTYNHMREWHFLFLRDLGLRKRILEESGAFSRTPDKAFLNETLAKIENPYQKEVYSYSVPLQERILLTAPEVLLVCFKMEKALSSCNTLFELNNFASAWLAVENILLAMAAEGLYGVTLVPFRTDKLKDILGMPEDMEIATFLPFGYPEKEPAIRQVSKAVQDTIHIDRW